MLPGTNISAAQFEKLKRFLESESDILVGVASSNDGLERPPSRISPRYKMAALSNSPERIAASPLAYIPALLYLIKQENMYSGVFSSDQARADLELRSSVYSLIEFGDSIKELKRAQKVFEKLVKYESSEQVTKQDVADIKMAHFALGTVASIFAAIAKDKDHELNHNLAEVISASLPGLRKFRKEISLEQVRTR